MGNEITYIHAGWLIDGSGAEIQNNMKIGLQNGFIRSIRNMTGPMPDAAESGGLIRDLSNCTLLPGLIDSHVHLALSPTATQSPPGDKMPEARNRILKHLNQYLTRFFS